MMQAHITQVRRGGREQPALPAPAPRLLHPAPPPGHPSPAHPSCSPRATMGWNAAACRVCNACGRRPAAGVWVPPRAAAMPSAHSPPPLSSPAARPARVTPQEALRDIVIALDLHPGEVDIQTKGLVLLGVLIQVGLSSAVRFWGVRGARGRGSRVWGSGSGGGVGWRKACWRGRGAAARRDWDGCSGVGVTFRGPLAQALVGARPAAVGSVVSES
jgi:hypothetical protein